MEVIYVNAGNDASGNPRRGWLVILRGAHHGFVDEGYSGRGAFDGGPFEHLKDSAWNAPEVSITPGEYRKLCKLETRAVRS